MDKDMRNLGFGLLAVTGVCWIVTIVGMINGGSGYHRWAEPFQQMGWVFFVAGFLVLYLKTGREIIRPAFATAAWVSGGVAIALFLATLVMNAASEAYETWFEAFEAGASIAMLVAVMTAIWSVGGWSASSDQS